MYKTNPKEWTLSGSWFKQIVKNNHNYYTDTHIYLWIAIRKIKVLLIKGNHCQVFRYHKDIVGYVFSKVLTFWDTYWTIWMKLYN